MGAWQRAGPGSAGGGHGHPGHVAEDACPRAVWTRVDTETHPCPQPLMTLFIHVHGYANYLFSACDGLAGWTRQL